ncbi:SDR family NAD(P)-dependent oxidoreductase [Vibrio vulnificus]|nr:SDR family NAD(P)-dependent oxidoreductase [Vibrio vulnificus]EKG2458833.1 SDR family NAD(P)-dependent oxidoreductase [Vibrio vulnificus]
MKVLEGKTILVTGSGRGIGAVVARSFAEQGAQVVLHSRTKEGLSELADDFEKRGFLKPIIVSLDLSSVTKEECDAVADLIKMKAKKLDGVVFNAAIFFGLRSFLDMKVDELDLAYNVNIRSSVMLLQSLLPLIQESDTGKLLFTTSIVGHQAWKNWADYSITKFATEGLGKLIAEEYKNSNIRTNIIDPGKLRTAMRAVAMPEEDPMTLPEPKDIMPVYTFLMSDSSNDINGKVIDTRGFLDDGKFDHYV